MQLAKNNGKSVQFQMLSGHLRLIRKYLPAGRRRPLLMIVDAAPFTETGK